MRQKQLPVMDRHMRVIDEFFINGMNKYQAMIKEGYSASMANRNCDVFGRRDVQEEIARRQAKMAKKAAITAEWIIEKYRAIVEADLGDLLTINPDGTAYIDLNKASPDHLASLGEFSVDAYTEGRGAGAREVKRIRVKLHDKLRALEALGRHLGMFNDSITVKGEVELIEKIQAGRLRAAATKLQAEETAH